MRRSAPFLLLAASIGCSTDAALAPLASARGALPSAALLPAAAYSLRTVFPLNIGYSSRALDVNDRNQVVGYVSTHAFLADSIGNVTLPGKQPGRYQANAINMRDEVVGRREDVGGTMYPLVWSSPSSQPKELRVAGEAHDINDYGEAVGEFSGPFRPLAFFWDT
ncbi:MAG: hypothetical protein JNJ98_06745, partial [Gemmatimonadetes bacterium]|nr:hypothetical protein [Gemmatimonadota bacterium]